MNTIRKPRTIKPASGTTTLTLGINGTAYQVLRLQPHPEVASVAYRLRKADGTEYDVALTEYGPDCSCPDFTFSREGRDPAGCKHVKALQAWGLLPRVPDPKPQPTQPRPQPQPDDHRKPAAVGVEAEFA